MSNTPLSRIAREDLPAEIAPAWDALNGLTGEPAFVEAFAAAPDLLNFVMNEFYAKIFFGGQVDERYKQLARLYMSRDHGCRTCNKQNVPGALGAGIEQAKIDAIAEPQSNVFDAAESAVLKLAREMAITRPEGRMDKELHEELSRHFDAAQICELSLVMGFLGGMAKLSFVLDLVEKEDYCTFA